MRRRVTAGTTEQAPEDAARGGMPVMSPEHVVLRNGFIIGSYGQDGDHDELHTSVDESTLQEFVALWPDSQGDDVILDFARRNGVLGVFVDDPEVAHFGYEEPCAGWRKYSRQAQAIMSIAARLRKDSEGSPDDWDTLREHITDIGDSKPEVELDWQKVKLAHVLNRWLKLGMVRPHVEWDLSARTWHITMRRESSLAGCFGALALMLAKRAAGADSIPICSYCGTAYVPKRKPKAGTSNYCPMCRKAGVPIMQAKRFSRAKSGTGEKDGKAR